MGVRFRSAAGSGRIVFTREPHITVAFDDGLELRFENPQTIRGRACGGEGSLVAAREPLDPARAMFRLGMLLKSTVWAWGPKGDWEVGVLVQGEVPCLLRYTGLRPVGGGGGGEGLLEIRLLAHTGPDARRLALEAFERLYTLMTNPLEIVRKVGDEEIRYVL